MELRGGEQTAYSRVVARVPARADCKYFVQFSAWGPRCRFSINGVEVGSVDFAEGQLGLLADAATVRFENVATDEGEIFPVTRPAASGLLSDEASRFSLEARASWTRANAFSDQLVLNGPKRLFELRAPAIVATCQPLGHDPQVRTLDQLLALQRKQIKLEGGEGLETIDTRLGGIPAKRTRFTTRDEHRSLNSVSIIALEHDALYSVAFVGTPEQFLRLRNDVEAIFDSFRVRRPVAAQTYAREPER